MKDIENRIEYRGQSLRLVFNLNVMEVIQHEYGTLQKWADKLLHMGDEPDVTAVIFGFREMLNEGIDMDNEEDCTNKEPLTKKQVGRILTEVGLAEVTKMMMGTVSDSAQSAEKNG